MVSCWVLAVALKNISTLTQLLLKMHLFLSILVFRPHYVIVVHTPKLFFSKTIPVDESGSTSLHASVC